MTELKALRATAETFCAANLRECCVELNEWRTKGQLRDGKLRELSELCEKYVGCHDGLKNAEAMVDFQTCAKIAALSSAPTAGSIDTDEFQDLLLAVEVASPDRDDGPHMRKRYDEARSALIAHIDTWAGRSAGERERELCAKMGAMQAQIDQLTAERSAGDAVPALYTCMGKGGTYEMLGFATGAGRAKLVAPVTIYRDVATGTLYFRDFDDFNERMEPIGAAPASGNTAQPDKDT